MLSFSITAPADVAAATARAFADAIDGAAEITALQADLKPKPPAPADELPPGTEAPNTTADKVPDLPPRRGRGRPPKKAKAEKEEAKDEAPVPPPPTDDAPMPPPPTDEGPAEDQPPVDDAPADDNADALLGEPEGPTYKDLEARVLAHFDKHPQKVPVMKRLLNEALDAAGIRPGTPGRRISECSAMRTEQIAALIAALDEAVTCE